MGCRPSPQSAGHARGNHILMFLSLSFSLSSPLSSLKKKKKVEGGTPRAVPIVDFGWREGFDFVGMVLRQMCSYFQDYGKAPTENMRLKYRRDEGTDGKKPLRSQEG